MIAGFEGVGIVYVRCLVSALCLATLRSRFSITNFSLILYYGEFTSVRKPNKLHTRIYIGVMSQEVVSIDRRICIKSFHIISLAL